MDHPVYSIKVTKPKENNGILIWEIIFSNFDDQLDLKR